MLLVVALAIVIIKQLEPKISQPRIQRGRPYCRFESHILNKPALPGLMTITWVIGMTYPPRQDMLSI